MVNQYLKVMPHSAYGHLFESAGYSRRLYKTYARCGAALVGESAGMEEEAVPQALQPARLWYGTFSVVVTMEFVEGKGATAEQLAACSPDDESGARVIAAAVVWLARCGLIYYDLHEPNIVIDYGGCWHLICYDMVVVKPVSV